MSTNLSVALPEDDTYVRLLKDRISSDDQFQFDTEYTQSLLLSIIMARNNENAASLVKLGHGVGVLNKANALVLRDASNGTNLANEKTKLLGVQGRMVSALSDITRYLLSEYDGYYNSIGLKSATARKDDVKNIFHVAYEKLDCYTTLIEQIDLILEDIKQSYLAYNFVLKSIQLSSMPNTPG